MAEVVLPATLVVESAHAEAAVAPAAGACPNCAARMTREYCAECGQRAWRGRFTLRSIVTHLVTDALDLNRGLLFTFVALVTRPGAMAREYVRGRTVSYANPVKYFAIVGTLATLGYVKSGVAGVLAAQITEGMVHGSKGELHPQAGAVLDVMTSYFTLLLAVTIPTTALASRLVFRRAGYNYAEHLIFNTFVSAQQCMWMVLALLLSAAAGGDPQRWLYYALPVSVLYFMWAAADFVGGPRIPAYVRAVIASGLAYVFFSLLFLVLGVLVGVVIAITMLH